MNPLQNLLFATKRKFRRKFRLDFNRFYDLVYFA